MHTTQRLRALIDIGLELAAEHDPDQLLQRLCVAARDLFDAKYVTLGIVKRDDRMMESSVTLGVGAEWAVRAPAWIEPGHPVPGILQTVVMDRRTLRGDNPGGDPASLGLPVLHPEIHAFLAAPIASPSNVYGWICLVADEKKRFTEDDERLAMALAGQVGRIYELEYEIMERKRAEEEIRRTEEHMRFALQMARVGIWNLDYPTRVLGWSETLEAQHGLQPGTFGGTLEEFIACIHPDDRAPMLETIEKANRSGLEFSYQYRTVWPDGTVRWLSGAGRMLLAENGEPARGVGVSLDVTERHRLEAQYQQAQKMEAVGRLASGVAHDFNNLLTVILGNCELLLANIEPADERNLELEEIHKAGTSATLLTRQLLAFSRKQIIEPMLLDLNVVLTDVRAMLGRLIGEDVMVRMALGASLAPVLADRGQVEQIVMNLAVNARDAMPNGGTLTIETANVDVDEDFVKTHSLLAPGAYVALTVGDTGTGMTPEVQARLFEPFFTTKEVGKGTGLGLATVHGIVSSSGGSIDVSSELGRGTSIKVYLPRASPVDGAVPAPGPAARPRAGGETVLVVEDEEKLRALIKRLLERLGYIVLTADGADEALRIFAQNTSIDVLLTDVVMPGASGPELTRQLIEQKPSLKVVYMSGYTEDHIVHHGVLNPGIAFLNKPFTSETLGRKIREVLDR